MKKILAIVLLMLVCVLFAGCSNQNMDIPKLELSPEGEETVLNEEVLMEVTLWETVETETWG